ncbi:MAG: hypothetical protein NC131_05825 [Roseburia sp.]|nr:hypothetical protein [Roseburia sp.]
MKIELYEYPPIFDSLQYFEYAIQLAEKLKNDKKILDKYHTEENITTFKKNLLVYHLLIADGTVINGTIAESNLKYQHDGWFIWLQTFTFFSVAVESTDTNEQFTYWFDKYFDKYFENINFGGRYFNEAINNYKGRQYYSCVCGLFPLIEFLERRISKFDGESVFHIKKALAESQVKDLSGYKKYFEEFESNLNQFLKDNIYAVSAETDKEPKFICRNRVLHGIFTRNINKTDCLKLFCIVKSMAQFANWLYSLEEIKKLEIELNI